MTEQAEAKQVAVSQAETNKAKRIANAKEKKGRNIVLLKRMTVEQWEGALKKVCFDAVPNAGVELGPDEYERDTLVKSIAKLLENCYQEVAGENEGLRETPDVFQWMEDNAVLGTVYGVRFSRYDKDDARRGYTRQEQTTIKNV